MDKEAKKIKPIITVENFEKATRVKILGIDISQALTKVNFLTEGFGDNQIGLEIAINPLTEILAGITPEDIENAKEILAPYKESLEHSKGLVTGKGETAER